MHFVGHSSYSEPPKGHWHADKRQAITRRNVVTCGHFRCLPFKKFTSVRFNNVRERGGQVLNYTGHVMLYSAVYVTSSNTNQTNNLLSTINLSSK